MLPRFVLPLLCFALAACGETVTDDAGLGDGGPADVGRADATVPRDARPPPLPDHCAPTPVALSCTPPGFAGVPERTAYELPVTVGDADACLCGDVLCTGERVAPGELALTAAVCERATPCEACEPFVSGTCRLPPLTAGEWHVTVNGRPAFDVSVTGAISTGPQSLCHDPAEPDDACPPTWEPTPLRIEEGCLPERARPRDRVAVEVMDPCVPCGASTGPCRVRVEHTDPGVISVRPHALPPSCDPSCAETCSARRSRCLLPPLARGAYTVFIGGAGLRARLVIADDAPADPTSVCHRAD